MRERAGLGKFRRRCALCAKRGSSKRRAECICPADVVDPTGAAAIVDRGTFMTDWISINERLPSNDRDVMVWQHCEGQGGWCEIGYYNGQWHFRGEGDVIRRVVWVSHWAEIDPPKAMNEGAT